MEIPEGWRGVISSLQKFKIQGGRGGGGLSEISSVVGVLIFSRTTQYKDIRTFKRPLEAFMSESVQIF